MNDLKEAMYIIFYGIWAIYVTIMCVLGFLNEVSLVNFLISGFIWVVLIMLPGVIRGR
jgi:hypothetical protein